MLGSKQHTAGNGIMYEVDYSNWLLDGQSLLSGTVVLDPAFTATVKDITISAVAVTPSAKLLFKVAGGTVDETFTLDVQVVTQHPTETKNDQVSFRVVAP